MVNKYEYLSCPNCSSDDIGVENGIVHCQSCGYKSESSIQTEIDKKVTPYYNPLLISWELTRGNSVNRSFMNACIKSFVSVEGRVLDLGSGKNPKYLGLISKDNKYDYIKADGNINNEPDLLIDFERKFPIKDKSFDRIFLFNVLEHIYDYKFPLKEINRILKDDGVFYLYVPFFIKIHGSPLDFYRYTHFTLFRSLEEAGFNDVKIYASGGFLRPLSEILNWLSSLGIGYLLFPIYFIFSLLDDIIGKLTRNNYLINYPFGYFAICRKSSFAEHLTDDMNRKGK